MAGAIGPVAVTVCPVAGAIGPVAGTVGTVAGPCAVGPLAGTIGSVPGTVCPVAGAMGTVAWAGLVHVTISPLGGVGNIRYQGTCHCMLQQCGMNIKASLSLLQRGLVAAIILLCFSATTVRQ